MSLVPVLILFAMGTVLFGSLWTLDEIVWRRQESRREARMRAGEGNPSRPTRAATCMASNVVSGQVVSHESSCR